MLPVPSRRFSFALAALAASLVMLPARAADEKKPAKDEAPVNPYQAAVRRSATKPGGEAKVYRNEDLYELYGAPPAEEQPVTEGEEAPRTEATPSVGAAAPGAAESDDPLKQMLEQQAKAAEHQKQILAAEAGVTAAREKIADLEKRKLALRNPAYLPRQAPPAEQAEEWNQLGTAARIERTEGELQKAREQLGAAEAELERLRRTAP